MSYISENLRTIIGELNKSQTNFAQEVGITYSYIYMLLNDKRFSISETLAFLIEELYGYSAQWVMENKGEKMKDCFEAFVKENPDFIDNLKLLNAEDLDLVLEYIDNLEKEEIDRRNKRTPKYKRSA